MMRSRLLGMLLFLAMPCSAHADMIMPGYSRVPHHFIFEAAGDYSEYRFFWTWSDQLEPMNIAFGKPFRLDGTHLYVGHIVAIPVKTAEGKTQAQLLQLVKARDRSMLTSDLIDFRGSLPFYDARRELVSTYRITVVPGEEIKLDLLGQNEEPWWSKATRFAAGIFLSLGIIWAGFRLIRRFRKRPETRAE